MDQDVKEAIITAYYALPPQLRKSPASEAELLAFEAVFGPIPEDFRWYLATCGGGIVGSERLDDIQELARSHHRFRAEYSPPRGWTMQDVFIIGWDGWGNPFGIEIATGRILVEDHEFGGIHEFSPSLEDFLSVYFR